MEAEHTDKFTHLTKEYNAMTDARDSEQTKLRELNTVHVLAEQRCE